MIEEESSDEHINEAWGKIIPYIDAIFYQQSGSVQVYLNIHSAVFYYCSIIESASNKNTDSNKYVKNNIRGSHLYSRFEKYLKSYCSDLMKKGAHLMDEDLLKFYTTEWEKYEHCSKGLQLGCGYLNSYWVKRSRSCENGNSGPTLEIYNLAIVIWRETVFKLHYKEVLNAALKLINRQRRGEFIETKVISLLVSSYKIMGIYADGESSSLILYKHHFEDQFLKTTDNFYSKESTTFLTKNNNMSEYLQIVKKRLYEEADKVSQYLDPSTRENLVKTVEQALIQNHLVKFYDGFQGFLKLEKNDDLKLMYLLVNRNPKDLDNFIELFQNFLQSEGLLLIENCSEMVKSDVKIYTTTIVNFYKKYTNVISTVFENHKKFQTAFQMSFQKFTNENVITTNTIYKSSELIAAYCDHLLKNCNQNNDLDQNLEDVLIVYKFIENKDVFQEYYSHLLSKRLVNQTSFDESAEFLMVSKLKTTSGASYTQKFERMLQDVRLSRDISKEFAQKNTEPLQVDFNIMVLQSGSWPFTNSTHCNLPGELEKCVSQFSKFYSEKHSGKRLTWIYNWSSGEIVTNNFRKRYIIECSSIQIAILLLFNTSDSWSLSQIHQQTDIKMEYILNIAQILLKSKLVTCENAKNLTEDSVISLNQSYNNRKNRININLPLKCEVVREKNATKKHIDQDRTCTIQAAMVKIMKTRKILKHLELINETLQVLSSKFQPKIAVIKRNIESLIQKEYITLKDTEETYHYIA